MWYLGAFHNIINMDFLKRIYICKSSEFEFLGDIGLREYVLCGTDAGNDKPTILKSFDTFEEADLEMASILQRLRRKE
jgi:hypothetical protein